MEDKKRGTKEVKGGQGNTHERWWRWRERIYLSIHSPLNISLYSCECESLYCAMERPRESSCVNVIWNTYHPTEERKRKQEKRETRKSKVSEGRE